MSARRAGEGERLVRSGNWEGWHPTQMLGLHLSGKTVGIVGMGRIGQAIARRCHFGFGMKVAYFSRSPKELDFDATAFLMRTKSMMPFEVLDQFVREIRPRSILSWFPAMRVTSARKVSIRGRFSVMSDREVPFLSRWISSSSRGLNVCCTGIVANSRARLRSAAALASLRPATVTAAEGRGRHGSEI